MTALASTAPHPSAHTSMSGDGRPPSHRPSMALEVIGLSKSFGHHRVLEAIDLRVREGSVHALLGENGAGKSTLVKCIVGQHRPDQGAILLHDHEHSIQGPRDAHALGIGMVYQHFTLAPNLSVLENLVLPRNDLPLRLHWPAERLRLQAMLAQMPFTTDLDAPVSSLTVGEKQKVEILKQLCLGRQILILDEPTSVLTPTEADEVLRTLRQLARDQRLTVIMITHKMREVFTYCDEVTVLRAGHALPTRTIDSVDVATLSRDMIGDRTVTEARTRAAMPSAAARLHIRGLQADNARGLPALRGIDLSVSPGEILGVAGVSGNGQKQLVEVLSGQSRATAGTILVDDAPYTARRAEMMRHRFHCLPEEPLRNACVPDMSVAENLAFRDFDRPAMTWGGFLLRPRRIAQWARDRIHRFGIRAPSPRAPIASLSGGNVQRVVLAREVTEDVAILVAANPCFGLDFASVAQIHARLVEARNRGAAVLLVSEDLDELLQLSDRIVVMFDGQIVHACSAADADRHEIGQRMVGQ